MKNSNDLPNLLNFDILPKVYYNKMDIIETVRIIVHQDNDKVLMLQKSHDSKNPLFWELPGGKVERLEPIEAVKKELLEETGIDLDISDISTFDKLEVFKYTYQYNNKKYSRSVRYFIYKIDKDKIINFERNWRDIVDASKIEDKHIGFMWMDKEIFLSESHSISKNSKMALKKFFQLI
ncbi:NUDIX hydrolase [Candidatus Dojkabacteria bacterium]|uniref:NUDIX hydrolase n=1 Tax=Candidatus Dojkabacteria bacterium TaxID=2099670 RepID=A0A3M0YZ37_9BACT|nr:MAG: NUDIX hydrolase [Candidatus Dojkabacteria bacterium]